MSLLSVLFTCSYIAIVEWNIVSFNDFSISNGVKQGGVITPKFFTVYVDYMFSQLQKLGLGCLPYWLTLDKRFGYADDIVLFGSLKL